MAIELTSPAFEQNGTIPKAYSCEGADVSPALRWTAPPAGAKSFALIADDPDAPGGTWVHWVIFNMPADQRELPEGVPPSRESLSDGTRQGMNDFRRTGYGGPCPPPGKPHRYYFKLYALDSKLDVKPRATRAQVMQACKGHVLAEAKLVGNFGR